MKDNTLQALPTLMLDLKERALPSATESKTLNAPPHRNMLRILTELPKATLSKTDASQPISNLENKLIFEPILM
jgi:hypothetical protein